jgi:hypothetical protein
MPARLDLTPEQMLERVREQTRLRVQRYRERRNGRGGNATPIEGEASTGLAPSPSHSPTPSSSTKTTPLAERLAQRARRFAPPPGDPRLKAPDAAYFRGRLEKYPRLDLDDEVDNALDWLATDGGGKRYATIRYFNNWFERQEAKRLARLSAPTNGTANGTYHQPHTQQGRNPGPPDLPLFEGPVQRIEPAEMARFIAARADVPLADKLARVNGRKR